MMKILSLSANNHQAEKYHPSLLSDTHGLQSCWNRVLFYVHCFICLKDQTVCFILCTLTSFYADNFLPPCSAGRKRGFLSRAKGDRRSASLYPFYGFHSRSLPQRGDFILLLKSNRQEERWQQAGERGNNGCRHLFEGVYTFCLLIWFAAVCVNRKRRKVSHWETGFFFWMKFVSPAEVGIAGPLLLLNKRHTHVKHFEKG